MKVTLQSICNEASAFQHSNEFFEIIKECAEIEVLQQYVECQEFVSENTEYVESLNESCGAGYMMEAASKENVEGVKTSIKEKALNVLNRLKGAAVRVLKGLLNVIQKFINSTKALFSDRGKVRKFLCNHPEYIKDAARIVTDTAVDIGISFVLAEDEDTNKLVNNPLLTDAGKSLKAPLSANLLAAITDFNVCVNRNKCMPTADLIDFIERAYVRNEDIDPAEFLRDVFNKSTNKHNPLMIIVSSERDLINLSHDLNELITKIPEDKVANGIAAWVSTPGSRAVAALNECAANDIRLIADVIKYRNESLSSLKKFIDDIKKTNKATKKADGNTKEESEN